MGPRQCQVCNEAPSKYKCPSCVIPYCSLKCFKKHKETPCSKPVDPAEKSAFLLTHEEKSSEGATPSKPETHKENLIKEASPVKLVTFEQKSTPAPNAHRPLYVDDPSEILQRSQLEAIASSVDIRDALNNKEIRELVLGIDSSTNPELELDIAMGSEAFQTFTNKILSSLNAESSSK